MFTFGEKLTKKWIKTGINRVGWEDRKPIKFRWLNKLDFSLYVDGRKGRLQWGLW
jgi:hypothetical protein